MTDTKKQARAIRFFRWIHRKVAVALFIFFLLVSVTGILLGMKKQTGLLAPTQKGVSPELSTWLPIDVLCKKAQAYLTDSVGPEHSIEMDRIDIRPEKGVVKFQFKHHYIGLQLDGTNGRLLSIEKRHSDFIERLHDGSLVDGWFGLKNDEVKVGYTLIIGTSLFLLVVSGIWLWYGPKRLRRAKRGTGLRNEGRG